MLSLKVFYQNRLVGVVSELPNSQFYVFRYLVQRISDRVNRLK